MGLSNVREEKVTEEEIRHLVSESHEQGVIDEDERNMLNRVLRVDQRHTPTLERLGFDVDVAHLFAKALFNDDNQVELVAPPGT